MRKVELSGLMGIRFYAALLVYLSHVTIIPGMETLSGASLLFNAGVVGVSFFFVLSGFILTYNYADVFRDGVSAGNYKRFIWDRLAKLYPVHVAALLMILPVAVFSPNLALDWRALPFHLLLAQCWWPLTQPTFYNYLNVPSWSISCEWFFYLLAPMAMFLTLGDMRRRLQLLGVVTVYVCCLGLYLWRSESDFERLYLVSWFAPSRFVEFLLGMVLARVYLTMSLKNPAVAGIALQSAGVIALLAGALFRQYAPWPLWGGLLYIPGSALLIHGLAQGGGFFTAHLNKPWLKRLGTASFSLYLIHAPILRAIKGIWLHFGWEVRSWAAFVVVATGMFIVVQGMALIMNVAYEMPLQTYLRSLLKSHFKRTLATVSA